MKGRLRRVAASPPVPIADALHSAPAREDQVRGKRQSQEDRRGTDDAQRGEDQAVARGIGPEAEPEEPGYGRSYRALPGAEERKLDVRGQEVRAVYVMRDLPVRRQEHDGHRVVEAAVPASEAE